MIGRFTSATINRQSDGTYSHHLRDSLLLAIALSSCLQAGFIKVWQLKETADAPVLVVGRILTVQKIERVPSASLPWKDETWTITAEVQVLRSFSNSKDPFAADRLQLHFLAYGPSVTQFVNGNPPPLPDLEPGQVRILPLRETRNAHSDVWQLMADSGTDLTIPARAEIADAVPLPATARAFLDREIANALSRGTPREVSGLASYLATQNEDLTAELMPLLDPAIGDDRPRWAEVGANLLAAQAIPRPSAADLLAAKFNPKDWPGRQSLFLAQAALHKLKPSPETDSLLIATWIAEAPFHAWGSANSLLEYVGNPITTETLRQALRDDLAGSSYIALVLAHAGNRAILPEALARALTLADRPAADPTDLQGAAALLRDFGSDSQLKQLAALVRKYQTQNQKFYRVLWQDAAYAANPREARVLAVVLRDRRIAFGEVRECDLAVEVLEKAVHQNFGSNAKTLPERNAAVARALAWLESQGLAD